MRTPNNPAIRKAAKGAVMAGTAAIAAVAVTALVKRRIDNPSRKHLEPAPREDAE
ncbi:hypothetical protein [Glycomyces dulcitolivorans]|jgi:hypothetical protein|uniref:hypothetical protein n=1 Tax=Glycomyces dulcitolivorans TaxID=2200759 RepID=UPI00130073DE|nr:hypothetical protein [Glycomyces dulcitolivorans]